MALPFPQPTHSYRSHIMTTTAATEDHLDKEIDTTSTHSEEDERTPSTQPISTFSVVSLHLNNTNNSPEGPSKRSHRRDSDAPEVWNFSNPTSVYLHDKKGSRASLYPSLKLQPHTIPPRSLERNAPRQVSACQRSRAFWIMMVLALAMSLVVGIGIGYAAASNSDPTPGVPGPQSSRAAQSRA